MNLSSLFRKVTVAAAGAAGLLTLALPAANASAAVYSQPTGSPGGVSVPAIYVGDLLMPAGYTQFTLYAGTGPTVYRSPAATGVQTVQARYYAEQWNGSRWVVVTSSRLLTGYIGANQYSVQFVAPYLQPTVARGYFRVTWGFDWYNQAGGRIGSTFVVPNVIADHVCVTPARLCQSLAGYVQTGANRYSW